MKDFQSQIDELKLEIEVLKQQMLKLKEHFAVSWRDDDSPQAEKTFGVK